MERQNPEHFDPCLASALALRLNQRLPIFKLLRESQPLSDFKDSSASHQAGEKTRHGNSLKKICTKILRLYHKKEDLEIFLNEFAQSLNIERRRIYDIINILEALDIVVKKSKNVYIWKNINLFVTKLKILAAAGGPLAETLKLFYFETKPMTSKKKMLTYLSLKVLKLFYTNKHILSFAEIMKICESHYLQNGGEDSAGNLDEFEGKNRIRRLYDIINVFKALGLIAKVSQKGEKKIYVWQGENGFLEQISRLCPSENPTRVTSPGRNERTQAEEEVSLGKRLENSAFRICQKFQGQELFNLKSVLVWPGVNDKSKSL